MKREHHKETSPREVELKVHLPPGSRTELERSSSFSGAEPKQTHLVTTYFDTKEGFLDKAGLTLRVRRIEDVRIQTAKSRPTARGVASDRSEWEWPIGQDEPDVGCLEGIGKLAGVAHVVAGRLRPVFVTDIRRTTRLPASGGRHDR